MSQVERRDFQAEVKQLLDLMVHALYSNKDIFLRELISNASDAIDKRRFEDLTNGGGGGGEPEIRLEADRAARTLSISDTGVGMSRDEVIRNLGTIARSGTKEFLANLRAAQKSDVPPELIGQFGVGFYSAFMVADKVTVLTRRSGEATATLWESTGDGAYTLADGERAEPGTTVTLHLKPVDEEQGLHDYTADDVLRDIVRKHSDFVGHPIRMKVWRNRHDAAAAPVFEDQTLNSRKAIWDRAKSEVTAEEYNEFYRHISHDWQEPLLTVPAKMEGTFEAHALLFVPRQAPPDLYSPEMKRGLQLYVKRVFVMDECKDLMPQHLRFVKGVLDAHDLSLNVSREMLQKDRQIQIIRRQLVKKVMSSLEDLQRNKPDEYLTFWAAMGAVLKEGLLAFDVPDKDKLLDLVMAASTADATKLTSLSDYIGRMKDGQDAIYFITAPSVEAARRSPLLEAYVKNGYEVLLFADAVDELWLDRAPRYKEKAFQSVGRGEAKLGSEDERKQAAVALEEKQKTFSDLLLCLRSHLQDELKDVRLSARLTSSAVCLVGDEADMTPRMRRILEQMGQKAPPQKRILEVNPDHPLFSKLQAVFAENRDDPRLRSFARVLLGQAHLAESGNVPDPAAFNEALADLMLRAA